MKVKDHNIFRLFDYTNFVNENFELGQVLIKLEALSNLKNFGNPIGVVVQTHPDGDCRTDMYGNTSPEENRLATLEEIQKFRPELIEHLVK